MSKCLPKQNPTVAYDCLKNGDLLEIMNDTFDSAVRYRSVCKFQGLLGYDATTVYDLARLQKD